MSIGHSLHTPVDVGFEQVDKGFHDELMTASLSSVVVKEQAWTVTTLQITKIQ